MTERAGPRGAVRMDDTNEQIGSTGDPRVDAVVRRLDAVDQLDPEQQLEAFATMHADLVAVLDDAEAGQPPVS